MTKWKGRAASIAPGLAMLAAVAVTADAMADDLEVGSRYSNGYEVVDQLITDPSNGTTRVILRPRQGNTGHTGAALLNENNDFSGGIVVTGPVQTLVVQSGDAMGSGTLTVETGLQRTYLEVLDTSKWIRNDIHLSTDSSYWDSQLSIVTADGETIRLTGELTGGGILRTGGRYGYVGSTPSVVSGDRRIDYNNAPNTSTNLELAGDMSAFTGIVMNGYANRSILAGSKLGDDMTVSVAGTLETYISTGADIVLGQTGRLKAGGLLGGTTTFSGKLGTTMYAGNSGISLGPAISSGPSVGSRVGLADDGEGNTITAYEGTLVGDMILTGPILLENMTIGENDAATTVRVGSQGDVDTLDAARVTVVDGSTFEVTDNTTTLGSLAGDGTVSVAEDAVLILTGRQLVGAKSDQQGNLDDEGTYGMLAPQDAQFVGIYNELNVGGTLRIAAADEAQDPYGNPIQVNAAGGTTSSTPTRFDIRNSDSEIERLEIESGRVEVTYGFIRNVSATGGALHSLAAVDGLELVQLGGTVEGHTIAGNADANIFEISGDANIVRVLANNGEDTIRMTGGTITNSLSGGSGDDFIDASGGRVVGTTTVFPGVIDGGNDDDHIVLRDDIVAANVSGGFGDDLIEMRDGTVLNRIDGSLGEDTIRLTGGTVGGDVNLGADDDLFQLGADATVGRVIGDLGSDRFEIASGAVKDGVALFGDQDDGGGAANGDLDLLSFDGGSGVLTGRTVNGTVGNGSLGDLDFSGFEEVHLDGTSDLTFEGTLAGTNLFVGSDAVLRGNGWLQTEIIEVGGGRGGSTFVPQGGDLTVVGRLSPGTAADPVSYMTFDGDVTFQDGSVYEVTQAVSAWGPSEGDTDIIFASGDIAFDTGSTVEVDVMALDLVTAGTRYAVASAEGDLTFDGIVTDSSALFDFETSVELNDVNQELVLSAVRAAAPDGPSTQPGGATPPGGAYKTVVGIVEKERGEDAMNPLAIAEVVDEMIDHQMGNGLVTALAKIATDGEVADAVDSLRPDTSGGVARATTLSLGVADRLIARRSGTVEGPRFGFAPEEEDAPRGFSILERSTDVPGTAGVWAQGYAFTGTQDATRLSFGADVSGGGVVFGADRVFAPGTLLGLALTHGTQDVRGRGTRSDAEMTALTVYGSHQFGPNRIEGRLTYGRLDIDTAREIDLTGDVAEGRTDGDILSVSASYSRDLFRGDWLLRPEAGISWTKIEQDGFTESGSVAALRYDALSLTETKLHVGLTGRRAFDMGGMPAELELFGRAAYSVMGGDDAQGLAFVAGGSEFANLLDRDDHASGELGLRVGFKPADGMKVSLGYTHSRAADFNDHTVSATFRWEF